MHWVPLEPIDLVSYRGATLSELSDHSVLAAGDSPETDTYTIKARTDLTNITAIRLELLPDESLPKQGPGRAIETGKAVLTEFQLAVRSPKTEPPRARFIRIELPGTQRVLSLAEVEIFVDRENVAPKGKASQSSTDGDGEANVRTNWALEIYDDSGRKSSLISVHEFDDFPSLRTKIVENPAFRFLIDPPDHATSSEFQCLLDLRGQGFKVERK